MGYVSTAIQKIRYLVARDDEQVLILEKNNGVYLEVNLDTPASRDAAITAAINDLLAGVPGALDTLNELATALGDDPNFAATVTTALGNRLVWKGAWTPAFDYVRNDLVLINGGLYVAPANFTSGVSFDKTNWVELVPPSGTYASSVALPATILGKGKTLIAWDDFGRADGLLTGTLAPSGQKYTSKQSGTEPVIRSKVMARNDLASFGNNGASDLFVPCATVPTVIADRFTFTPGSTATQNAVLGGCGKDFSTSSIQMEVGPTGWQLFKVLNSVITAISGVITPWATPLVQDGVTEYLRIITIDLVASTATLEVWQGNTAVLPPITFTDPNISQYWGPVVGVQIRRPLTTDGDVQFKGYVATGPVAPSSLPSTPRKGDWWYNPGDGASFVSCPDPWTPANTLIEIIDYVWPDNWAPGNSISQTILSQWQDTVTMRESIWSAIAPSGKLELGISLDGSTNSVATSSIVAATGSSGMWTRRTYDPVTGNANFYTSNDPFTTARSAVSWTPLGTTQFQPAGIPFDSGARLAVGARYRTIPFIGHIGYVALIQGGVLKAEFDARTLWVDVDSVGNRWTFTGTQWTWHNPIGVPNPLQLSAINDPPAPPAGQLDLYARKMAGRIMWRAMPPVGRGYGFQPALFSSQIVYIGPGATTTLTAFGCGVTSVGTVSNPFNELFGYYANFASGAVVGNTAGTGNSVSRFLRGTQPGSNGWFHKTRLALPDASYGAGATGCRVFAGLTNGTLAASVAADDTGIETVGFQFSSARGDTNWQFTRSGSGAATLVDTTIPFVPQHVYDCWLYCDPQGTTIYWRIDDLTAGTTAEGSATTTIPVNSIVMRAGLQIATLDVVARSIGLLSSYTETDR